MFKFTDACYRDETAARKTLEALRWPDGPICPHCGTIGHAYATKRPGVYRCAPKECRKDFSVTTRTVIGFNVGADVTWLMGSHFGIGSVTRDSRAMFTLDPGATTALVTRAIDTRAGGPQIGAGVRFLF